MSSDMRLAWDLQAALGESPVWSADEQALYFVDIKGRRIHRYEPGVDGAPDARASLSVDEDIGCIGLIRGGGFVAAMRSGVWRLGADGAKQELLAPSPENQETNRFNDGVIDPKGRFLAGTIDEPRAAGDAGLYRYDRRGLTRLKGGLMTSNGLAFSPDGRTLYHSDTPRFHIYAHDYDVETGEISEARLFAALDPDAADRGRPDGAAVDCEGCYWTALFEGGRLQRYSPGGALLAEYAAPVRCPTMVCFGGADLKTLFVTSARFGRPDAELAAEPQAGGLFALRVETAGLAKPYFDPAA